LKAVLLLEDGRAFEGTSAGTPGTTFGEVVFNTALSGYQETLTDPSYRGQIVVMTASHGQLRPQRRGCRVVSHPGGRVVTRLETFSRTRAARSIHEALTEAGVVGIHGVDTRASCSTERRRAA
jgi:carbamoyl-phosphate synthase small subunit